MMEGMLDGEKGLEEVVLTEMMRLNTIVSGIVTGLVIGLTVFLATVFLVIKGGEVVGPHLSLLGQYFIGYDVTWPGSLIGFAYGFGCGFGIGYSVARLYNWLVELRDGRPTGAA